MDKQVLIIEDSKLVTQILKDVINQIDGFRVSKTAIDPIEAENILKIEKPDVIVCDIEMPRMNGLTFLRKITQATDIPVIICSSYAEEGSDIAIRSFEYGAVEVIAKPSTANKEAYLNSKGIIEFSLKAAVNSKLKNLDLDENVVRTIKSEYNISKQIPVKQLVKEDSLILIGSSTGGPEALRVIAEQLNTDLPGIVVVQHMPKKYTGPFAQRLNQVSKLNIKEAEHGDIIEPGCMYIAPGEKQLMFSRHGSKVEIKLTDDQPLNGHKPSVDVMFHSASKHIKKDILAIILTGMGKDGADGMLALKNSGAITIAQNEESCVVYGMPKKAVEFGGVKHQLSITQIPTCINRIFK